MWVPSRNILAPALRLGYAVAPWAVLAQMIACKGGGTGALEQMVVADFLKNNYEQHVDNLKVRLKAKTMHWLKRWKRILHLCRIRGAKWRDISLDQISAGSRYAKTCGQSSRGGHCI